MHIAIASPFAVTFAFASASFDPFVACPSIIARVLTFATHPSFVAGHPCLIVAPM